MNNQITEKSKRWTLVLRTRRKRSRFFSQIRFIQLQPIVQKPIL